MPVNVSHLRRWFLLGAIALAVVVGGAYLYARWRLIHIATKPLSKMNIQFQQTAEGFKLSKSEQGRTIFIIRASKAFQYRQGGHAELHDVSITIYGRDAQRYDQIYGSDFQYDQQTGIVVAKGEVQIDLEANPGGLAQPDQTAPKELKDPVHLKTSNLVFNKDTGDAYTLEKVEFHVPEATGSAVGAYYSGKTETLDLKSNINVVLGGQTKTSLNAVRGVIGKNPRQIDLDLPKLDHLGQHVESDHGTVYLRDNNQIDRIVGTGKVQIHVEGQSPIDARSDRAELFMTDQHGRLQSAILSGNVRLENSSEQAMEGTAGRLKLNFVGQNILTTARASENVRLLQHNVGGTEVSDASRQAGKRQDVEVMAPIIDFVIAEGRTLKSAVTFGAAQIAILPAVASSGERTVVTAGKFAAKFDNHSRLTAVHGAPDAKIVNTAPGQPERVSRSQVLDMSFQPAGRVSSLVQQGNVAYVDRNLQAWGDRARYTPSDQMLYLTGSPRVVEGGMTTTARTMRLNRATGDAYAEADVKSTYSELKPQPDGAMLASSDPIHVTSTNMATHKNPGIATYTGKSRLWQDANIVEAPSIDFDRERRSVVAHGSSTERVSTALVQRDKGGNQAPMNITSDLLTYTDNERKVHFEGGVVAHSADATMTANQVDVYLERQKQTKGEDKPQRQLSQPSQVEKIIANGHIVILQPNRRAEGERLIYTTRDDKYVLTGGSPSIFDAEHGKITGVSLTFYKRDDRVLVEGDAQSPTVSQTRVAR